MKRFSLLALATATEVSGLSIRVSRQHFIATASTAALGVPNAVRAAQTEADLLKDLATAQAKLAELPRLVGDQQWDPIRSELRQPAINALWNTMDSGNTLRKLAKSRGDPEIIEAAETVAQTLRDVDQIVYSNAFSMEGKMAGAGLRTTGDGVGGKAQGGGGGQYRIKEPQELLRAAARSIDDVISCQRVSKRC